MKLLIEVNTDHPSFWGNPKDNDNGFEKDYFEKILKDVIVSYLKENYVGRNRSNEVKMSRSTYTAEWGTENAFTEAKRKRVMTSVILTERQSDLGSIGRST